MIIKFLIYQNNQHIFLRLSFFLVLLYFSPYYSYSPSKKFSIKIYSLFIFVSYNYLGNMFSLFNK